MSEQPRARAPDLGPLHHPVDMTVHFCGKPLAHINGRTYREALRDLGGDEEVIRKNQLTHWVTVCPHCDRLKLGAERPVAWPFRDHDGVMRTVRDHDGLDVRAGCETMSFGGFRFSRSAFEAGVHLVRVGDPRTPVVESRGAEFLAQPSSEAARSFCEAVCIWGRGQRVFARLSDLNGNALGTRVYDWLVQVPDLDPRDAVAVGIKIKGLAVSFASKHLRLLQPQRFPVLDQVLEDGLGIARNPAGYKLLTEMLSDFLAAHQLQESIAVAEGAIFLLVRQGVRAVDEG